MKEFTANLEVINNMPLDLIRKNLLMQEEIFKTLAQQLFTDRPSFYVSYIVLSLDTYHAEFFVRLRPYITCDIFNSKKDFKIYISRAIEIDNKTITEIAQNIKRNRELFREVGFLDIADDLFK